MKKLSFLITAGPTREYIDPVRFISNPSTGKMGYALAAAAIRKDFNVTLITGPVHLSPPDGARLISVVSAEQMCTAVLAEVQTSDVLIMSAAVCDYRPKSFSSQKMKKGDADINLPLIRTPDILQEVNKSNYPGIRVGFAAETHRIEEYALDKLKQKNLNIIVANNISQEGAGFASETNAVTVFSDKNDRIDIPLSPKSEIARYIIDFIVEYIRRINNFADR